MAEAQTSTLHTMEELLQQSRSEGNTLMEQQLQALAWQFELLGDMDELNDTLQHLHNLQACEEETDLNLVPVSEEDLKWPQRKEALEKFMENVQYNLPRDVDVLELLGYSQLSSNEAIERLQKAVGSMRRVETPVARWIKSLALTGSNPALNNLLTQVYTPKI